MYATKVFSDCVWIRCPPIRMIEHCRNSQTALRSRMLIRLPHDNQVPCTNKVPRILLQPNRLASMIEILQKTGERSPRAGFLSHQVRENLVLDAKQISQSRDNTVEV